MCDDAESQENELLALESIFQSDEDVLVLDTVEETASYKSGRFKVGPDFEGVKFKVHFSCLIKNEEEADDVSNKKNVSDITHKVRFLLPITLNFTLPPDYPSTNSPKITLVCKWLNRAQLSTLSKKLDEIWEEQAGQEILFTWYQFLKEDSLHILDLNGEISISQEEYMGVKKLRDLDPRVIQDVSSYSEILPALLEYNESQINKSFNAELFSCNVCFTEKYGKDCLQFKECEHVYCKNCITSYFELQIKEGNIKCLTCPELKCTSQAYPAQVKDLVTDDEFSRYETLLLQTTLDMMTDVMYCPSKYCQAPVVVEDDIGICSVCRFSFCPYCKQAYHGIESCRLKSAALRNMCKEYKEGDAGTKKEMEKRYGAKVLLSTIQTMESEEWITNNARNCPGCSASIEKNDGCNKMTCYKCKAYFCWLCMRTLSLANPYTHYNTYGSKCYNKLFEGVIMDDDMFDEYYGFM